ncbi:MAG: fibronectin type III domain-containing protein, partial [Candidatus Oxydemutatoraceae bacterium WSBS_2016_MAG_OTU14]
IFAGNLLAQANPSSAIKVAELELTTAYEYGIVALADQGGVKSLPTTIGFNTALVPVAPRSTVRDTSIDLEWDSVPQGETYLVRVFDGNGDNGVQIEGTTTSKTEYTIDNLFLGTTYTISVTAIDNEGAYPMSERNPLTLRTTGTQLPRLATPSIVSVIVQATQIDIDWDEVENGMLYEVGVYLGRKATGIPIRSERVTQTEHTFTGLEVSTAYTIRLIAIGDATTFISSLQSLRVVTSTEPRVENLRAKVNNPTSIVITWSIFDLLPTIDQYLISLDQVDEEGTLIEPFSNVYLDQFTNSSTIQTSDLMHTSRYRVEAQPVDQSLTPLAQVTSITFNTALPAPDIFALQASFDSLTVQWGAIAAAESYRATLYEGNDNTGTFQRTTVLTTTFFVAESLSPSLGYAIYISAIDDDGVYPESFASLRTGETRARVVNRLALPNIIQESVEVTTRQISLTWMESEGADAYEFSIYLGDEAEGDALFSRTMDVTSHVFEDLDSLTQYTIRIIALSPDVEILANSEQVLLTLFSRTDMPQNLMIAENTADKIVFTWDPVARTDNYTYSVFLNGGTPSPAT